MKTFAAACQGGRLIDKAHRPAWRWGPPRHRRARPVVVGLAIGIAMGGIPQGVAERGGTRSTLAYERARVGAQSRRCRGPADRRGRGTSRHRYMGSCAGRQGADSSAATDTAPDSATTADETKITNYGCGTSGAAPQPDEACCRRLGLVVGLRPDDQTWHSVLVHAAACAAGVALAGRVRPTGALP